MISERLLQFLKDLENDFPEFMDAGEIDVNSTTPLGDTPLHVAVITSNRDIVEDLLENGANPNASGEWENTPLHEAAIRRNLNLFELLLCNGGDPDIRNLNGDTAFDLFGEDSGSQ